MKIAPGIHIVGSGRQGFGLTDDYDCHVYLVDGGDEYALIDAGGGRDLRRNHRPDRGATGSIRAGCGCCC